MADELQAIPQERRLEARVLAAAVMLLVVGLIAAAVVWTVRSDHAAAQARTASNRALVLLERQACIATLQGEPWVAIGELQTAGTDPVLRQAALDHLSRAALALRDTPETCR